MKKGIFGKVLYVIGFGWFIVSIYPLVFTIISSMKSQFEFLSNSPWALPEKFNLSAYAEVLNSEFPRYFLNSTIVALCSVVLIILVGSLTAFALSKRSFKFKNLIFFLFMAGLYVPIHTTLIPDFLIVKSIGLYDTPWALIGPYVAWNIPISIVILTRFMNDIPDSYLEAAKIDGASWMRIYWDVVMPLTKPALGTLVIYNFVMIWNEFVYALVLLSSSQNRTLPLGLWLFQGQYSFNVPLVMAAIMLTVLPLLLIYLFFSEKMISGLTPSAEGSMK